MSSGNINFGDYLVRNERWLASEGEEAGKHQTDGIIDEAELSVFFGNNHFKSNNDGTLTDSAFNDWYARNQQAITAYLKDIGLGADSYYDADTMKALRESMSYYAQVANGTYTGEEVNISYRQGNQEFDLGGGTTVKGEDGKPVQNGQEVKGGAQGWSNTTVTFKDDTSVNPGYKTDQLTADDAVTASDYRDLASKFLYTQKDIGSGLSVIEAALNTFSYDDLVGKRIEDSSDFDGIFNLIDSMSYTIEHREGVTDAEKSQYRDILDKALDIKIDHYLESDKAEDKAVALYLLTQIIDKKGTKTNLDNSAIVDKFISVAEKINIEELPAGYVTFFNSALEASGISQQQKTKLEGFISRLPQQEGQPAAARTGETYTYSNAEAAKVYQDAIANGTFMSQFDGLFQNTKLNDDDKLHIILEAYADSDTQEVLSQKLLTYDSGKPFYEMLVRNINALDSVDAICSYAELYEQIPQAKAAIQGKVSLATLYSKAHTGAETGRLNEHFDIKTKLDNYWSNYSLADSFSGTRTEFNDLIALLLPEYPDNVPDEFKVDTSKYFEDHYIKRQGQKVYTGKTRKIDVYDVINMYQKGELNAGQAKYVMMTLYGNDTKQIFDVLEGSWPNYSIEENRGNVGTVIDIFMGKEIK